MKPSILTLFHFRDDASADEPEKKPKLSGESMPPKKKKRPAHAPNPLSNRAPQANSKSQAKKKAKKYQRSG